MSRENAPATGVCAAGSSRRKHSAALHGEYRRRKGRVTNRTLHSQGLNPGLTLEPPVRAGEGDVSAGARATS